jgi:uncharacterized membrane protein
MLRNTVSTILCAAALSFGTATRARAQNFISFDVPGATSTNPMGINADGAIVGNFVDSAGANHGFLLSGGTFTTLDYPGAVATAAKGINSQGDIVGTHTDNTSGSPSAIHGFLWQQGSFTALDYPGKLGLIAQRINDAGQVVGCNHDNDLGPSMHGFLYSDGQWSESSMAMAMHNGLTPDGSLIVGLFTDPATNTGRAYLSSGDNIAGFDFPFASATWGWDINPAGEVVGQYTDAAKATHGFLLILPESNLTFGITPVASAGTSYRLISIDYPGAQTTYAYGINASGHIVGAYIDSSGKRHGFLLVRERQHQD